MNVLIFRILLVFAIINSALMARASANSPEEMLAAGRAEETIATLTRQISATPNNPELSNLLCRAHYQLQEWNEAESFCRKAVSLDPENSDFHLWLGRVYGEKADRTNFVAAASLAGKVHAEFERAVQLNAKNLDARLDLTEFYVEAPGFMGGGEDKARQQAPSVGVLSKGREHWVFARIADHKKDPGTAESEYRQYIEVSNGDSEAWLNLALFLRRQARIDEMEQAIVKLNRAPLSKAGSLVEAAEALYRTGRNYALAVQLLRRYMAVGPVEDAPAFRAHFLLGEVLEKQGDKAGAATEYQASLQLARNFDPAQHALSRVSH
jgi:tetratricopeptide (TPR) repeat protein